MVHKHYSNAGRERLNTKRIERKMPKRRKSIDCKSSAIHKISLRVDIFSYRTPDRKLGHGASLRQESSACSFSIFDHVLNEFIEAEFITTV